MKLTGPFTLKMSFLTQGLWDRKSNMEKPGLGRTAAMETQYPPEELGRMLSGKPGRLSTNVSMPPLLRPATWTLDGDRASQGGDHPWTGAVLGQRGADLRIRAMVVSATRTDSWSGSSWMPLGKRRFSMTTVSSRVSVSYSSTLRRTGGQAFILKGPVS